MSWFVKTVSSSIGRKVIMALTGLLLIGFLIEHLVSNFMLFFNDGGLAYNEYAHFMAHNLVIRILEVGLFALFIFHIVDGIMIVRKNQKARPVGYAHGHTHNKVSMASKIMGPLGIIILIFLVLHLANFFAKAKILAVEPGIIDWMKDANGNYVTDAEGNKIRDLTAVVYQEFKMPVYSLFYILCMIPLGFHLYHGFQSAFQTLGIKHKKYTPTIEFLGLALSILIPLGFASIPLVIWLVK